MHSRPPWLPIRAVSASLTYIFCGTDIITSSVQAVRLASAFFVVCTQSEPQRMKSHAGRRFPFFLSPPTPPAPWWVCGHAPVRKGAIKVHVPVGGCMRVHAWALFARLMALGSLCPYCGAKGWVPTGGRLLLALSTKEGLSPPLSPERWLEKLTVLFLLRANVAKKVY